MSAMAEKGEGFYIEKKTGDKALDDETQLIEAALARADEETRIGIKAIFKLYWRGAMWSMLLSLALVMEGMDVGLVNNFFGQQAYIERFGHVNAEGKKFIPANWQAAINNGQQIGAVAGLLFNGWAQSRFGSRKVYMLAMVLLAAFGESYAWFPV
jgi:SP family general alpha glucoside:H+ symporter-like MFS transporter